MKDHWIGFKNVVYILGWTYMVAHLSWLNYVIITYLVTVNPDIYATHYCALSYMGHWPTRYHKRMEMGVES
jgi:hypothetical protein